ncbi:hypothetical protein DWB68_03155 [Galactobacter valiniphilus]|uniref:Uncharacterized protein n=1 Tax=Galactobacter valiniphilus TaxID=2676122 RepID=A0A399JCM9_9MICC|nr:hypothetical protein [Galactobacter valiniphilus]RII43311.1 hypothetical protein DWB68_03155 [Galactobacter valiniphilus]
MSGHTVVAPAGTVGLKSVAGAGVALAEGLEPGSELELASPLGEALTPPEAEGLAPALNDGTGPDEAAPVDGPESVHPASAPSASAAARLNEVNMVRG